MRRPLFLALLASLPLAAPAAAQSATQYLICSARNRENTAGYVTGAVPVAAASSADAQSAWGRTAPARYSALPASASCQTFASAEAAAARRASLVDGMKDDGLRITDVTWSYAPAAAVAAPPVDSAAAADARTLRDAQGFCQIQLVAYQPLIPCDCFAKMVLHHRQQHPDEVITDIDGTRPVPVGDLAGGFGKAKLNCTECLTDDRIAAYVKATMQDKYAVQLRMNAITQAKVDQLAACTLKGFAPAIRANPAFDQIRPVFDRIYIACTGSRP